MSNEDATFNELRLASAGAPLDELELARLLSYLNDGLPTNESVFVLTKGDDRIGHAVVYVTDFPESIVDIEQLTEVAALFPSEWELHMLNSDHDVISRGGTR